MRRALAFVLLAACGPAEAQEVAIPEVIYPKLVGKAPSAAGFVPKGWKLERQQSGDLNGDGRDDLLLVLRQDDPKNLISDASFSENPVNTNPRMLAVAFAGKSANSYRLALQDHELIPRITEPVFDDVLQDEGTAIKQGSFTVALFAFSDTIRTPTYQFRYQHKRFELIGYEEFSSNRFSGKTVATSANYLSRKVEISLGPIENDTSTTSTKKLKPAPLLSIGDIGDGLQFTPLTLD